MTRFFICDFCKETKTYELMKLLFTREKNLEHICNSCMALLHNYVDRGDFKNSINRADYGVLAKVEEDKISKQPDVG